MAKDDMNNEENRSGHGGGGGGGGVGLPSDIIVYDILTRVPTESLIRFRCVNKQWHDLIKDPLFVDMHSRRSNNPLGFVCRYGLKSRKSIYRPRTEQDELDDEKGRSFLVFFDTNKTKEIDIPLPPLLKCSQGSDIYISILDSFNGLLLMCCETDTGTDTEKVVYLVYNPMIPFCSMNVPDPEMVHWRSHNRFEYRFCLAYDSTMAKYKVVCYGVKFNTKEHDIEYFCKIVTLGVDRDSWRELVVPNPEHKYSIPFFDNDPRPVFANGLLHWGFMEPAGKILSLDVCRETFYTVRVPPECHTGEMHTLLEIGGLLAFVDHVSTTQLKSWVLKKEDLEDKHVWREECSIDMSQFDMYDFLEGCIPFALHTHPKREFIFFRCTTDYADSLYVYYYYSYDMELKKLDLVYEEKAMNPLHWHVNSLTLP